MHADANSRTPNIRNESSNVNKRTNIVALRSHSVWATVCVCIVIVVRHVFVCVRIFGLHPVMWSVFETRSAHCAEWRKKFAQPKMTNNTVNNLTQYEKHCATYDKHTFAFGQQRSWRCMCASIVSLSLAHSDRVCVPFRNSKFSNTEKMWDTEGEEEPSHCFFINLGSLCIEYGFFLVFCYGKMCKNSKWIQTHSNQIPSAFFFQFAALLCWQAQGRCYFDSVVYRSPFLPCKFHMLGKHQLFCFYFVSFCLFSRRYTPFIWIIVTYT